jgi:hypothetical protein
MSLYSVDPAAQACMNLRMKSGEATSHGAILLRCGMQSQRRALETIRPSAGQTRALFVQQRHRNKARLLAMHSDHRQTTQSQYNTYLKYTLKWHRIQAISI